VTLTADELARRKESSEARASEPPAFEALDRAGLFKALDVFAKNWLAHDGSWFLAAEERYGIDAAMELDAAAWRRFAADAQGHCGWEFHLAE
jgi:Family of unknown function (DUF6125)